MSFSQVAKLFVRGRIFNDYMKNLPSNEKQEIENIVEMVMNDPNLQNCQREFCNALARTIKNEYCDRDVGKVDYQIAVMKSALVAKSSGCTKTFHEIFNDSQQRKKWVQTFVFNYLRQILRENKKAIWTRKVEHCKLLEEFICEVIVSAISTNSTKCDVKRIGDEYIVNSTITLELRELLDEIRQLYFNKVEVIISDKEIMIKRIGDPYYVMDSSSKESLLVREHSFDQDDGESDSRDVLEAKVTRKEKPMESDVIDRLKERIPEHALPVLNIYLEDNRPEQYIKKYGEGRPKIAHVSEFLGWSPKEVKKALSIIKINFMIVDLGY